MKTTSEYLQLLKQFKESKALAYGIQKIGLFGSVARGEHTEDSDVDVCFEGKAIGLFSMAQLKGELEQLLGTTVELFCKYPAIPWKDVMKQRDLIAHHYFRIDADSICTTIKEDLPILYQTVSLVKQDLMDTSASARNFPK